MWIAAVIGAALGQIGHGINSYNAVKYYEKQIDDLKEQKKLALADLELDFNNAKLEANKNADRSDAQSTLSERYIGEDINESIEGLTLSQLGESLTYNNAAQDIAKAEGDALSSQAASGIRTGGSLSTAIELEAAKNAQQLQLEEDMKRNSDNLQLQNVLKGLQSNIFGLQANRTDANDLRNSFEEGGYQFEKFQNAKTRTEAAYEKSLEEARDARKANHAFGEGDGRFWINNLVAGLTMGAQAQSFASSISETYKNVKKPEYGSTTSGNNTMNFNNFNFDNKSGMLSTANKVSFRNIYG